MEYERLEPHILLIKQIIKRKIPQEDAEDFFQDIILSMLRSPEFKNESTVETWICACLRGRIAGYYRQRNRYSALLEKFLRYKIVTNERQTMDMESLELEDLINHLNPKQQKIMQLLAEGFDYNEIAESIGMTYEAVRSTERRAIIKLHKFVSKD